MEIIKLTYDDLEIVLGKKDIDELIKLKKIVYLSNGDDREINIKIKYKE